MFSPHSLLSSSSGKSTGFVHGLAHSYGDITLHACQISPCPLWNFSFGCLLRRWHVLDEQDSSYVPSKPSHSAMVLDLGWISGLV